MPALPNSGRKPIPVDVIVARGQTHLTKAEIEKRRAAEVHPKNVKIDPPEYMVDRELRKRFRRIARELAAIGVWAAIDADELARFVDAQWAYEQFTTRMKDALECGEVGKAMELQRAQDRAFKQAHAIATAFGMNCTARCKIVVPKPPEAKPKAVL